jgi:predicted amidohydrolase YtcJ
LGVPPSDPLYHSGLIRASQVLSQADGVVGDAVWWQEGAIKAVGRAADLERKVPTRVPRYDLPEATVTPGFVDGHTHFGLWALGRRRVLLAGAGTRAEALRRVASGTREQGWVLGQGWDANRWEAPPDRWSLDQVTSGPAFLESSDLHAAWANSAALSAAGITRATADPPGGRMVRDASGEPTGLLLERAAQLVQAVLPVSEPGERVSALKEAQAFAHRVGITGIHDTEGPDVLRALRTLDARGELRLRVLFHPPVAQLPSLLAHGVRSGQGGDWLVLGGVKLFLDGSLGSRTAWMLDPYEDAGDSGMPLTTEAEARQAVRMASAGGLACTVHAIGDAAVRRALDLLEPLPPAAMPHRIEHMQCIHPDDLDRAAGAGIVASMQPAHLPSDVTLAEERWGRRSRGAYAFRSLLQHGTILAFGSDVPVAPLDPRRGVVAAMERAGADGSFSEGWYPDERLTFPEVVRAYTLGNAIAAGMSDRQGRLAPGYDADLVAWAVDPAIFRGDATAFGLARVDLTVVGGEVVYRRS